MGGLPIPGGGAMGRGGPRGRGMGWPGIPIGGRPPALAAASCTWNTACCTAQVQTQLSRLLRLPVSCQPAQQGEASCRCCELRSHLSTQDVAWTKPKALALASICTVTLQDANAERSAVPRSSIWSALKQNHRGDLTRQFCRH